MAPSRLFRLGILIVLLAALSGCDYFVSAESGYQSAQEFVAKGDYRRALIDLKNALQKEPELHGARLLLADVALWLGDPVSAEKELRKVPREADPARYADVEMRVDLALGRPQAVIDRLAAGSADVPPARQAYYRGAALLALRQGAAAEEQLLAAVKGDPSSVEAQVALAEAIAAQNDMPRALEKSAEIVSANPESALAWQARGVLLTRRGENEEAAKALERARTLAPNQLQFVRHAALLAALTDVRLSMGDVEKARATSADLTKLASGSTIAVLTASRVAIAANDYVGAAADLRRVVNGNPRLSQARFLLGVVLLAQGNLEQAGRELSTVVEQVPENLEARQLLAQVRMRQEDPDAAMRVIVPALQSGTDDLRLNALMDTARAKSSGGAAIDLLERALQNTPDNQSLQLQLASSYMQAGKAQQALALLRKNANGERGTQRDALLLQAIIKAEGTAAARSEVESIVKANPSDASALSLAAAFYAHIGDVPASRRLLTEALQKDPKNVSLLLTLAQVEWSSGRPTEARAALQNVLEIDPGQAQARLSLAQIELSTGNVEAGRNNLEILRKKDASAWVPRLMLARLALTRDDAKLADALVEEAVSATPDNAGLRSAAGMLYLNNGRYDRAITHFRKGTQIDPGDPAFWLLLGRAQQAIGQEGPAREALAEALELRPNWLAAEGALAFIDLQSGQNNAALDRVRRLQQKSPNDPAVLMLSGEVHAALRDYAEASRLFDSVAKLQPSAQLAYKAYQVRRVGQQPKPAEPLERWVAQNPGDLASRIMLAEAYTVSGDPRRAAEQYEQILAAQPKHVASLNNLAWVYFELKDRRAEDAARQAYALAPKSAAVADTLGWILVETGRPQDALPMLEQAVAADSNPEIRYHYAVALVRSGSDAEGRALLDALLRDNQDFPSRLPAQQLRDSLKSPAAAGGGGL